MAHLERSVNGDGLEGGLSQRTINPAPISRLNFAKVQALPAGGYSYLDRINLPSQLQPPRLQPTSSTNDKSSFIYEHIVSSLSW